jgi:hypothetical protein
MQSSWCRSTNCRRGHPWGEIIIIIIGVDLKKSVPGSRCDRHDPLGLARGAPKGSETFGTERLTGALLDRLTHHVTILEMNGDSYRLAQSRAQKAVAEP